MSLVSALAKARHMARQFVNQLAHQQSVNETYLASNKQLRSNRNGNLFLSVDLTDRTGILPSLMWNASDEVYQSFENGDYVRVAGNSQVYQGGMQLILNSIETVHPSKVNEEDFVRLGQKELEALEARLAEMLRGIKDPHLRALAECYLMDEPLMRRIAQAPAGVKNHHAYQGGLLEHIVSVMELILLVRTRYPQVDGDLLLIGGFLHDLGKIDELSYERDLAYTDEGQLLGHIVLAVSLLDRKLVEAAKLSGEPLPEETVLRIKHMILSHHGEYSYGSPKLPMTLEAIALHHIDNLDAKLHSFQKLIDDDPNTDSNWTTYFPNLGRKLYKGKG